MTLRERLGKLVKAWSDSNWNCDEGMARRKCASELLAALSAHDDTAEALRGLVEAAGNAIKSWKTDDEDGRYLTMVDLIKERSAALAALDRERGGK